METTFAFLRNDEICCWTHPWNVSATDRRICLWCHHGVRWCGFHPSLTKILIQVRYKLLEASGKENEEFRQVVLASPPTSITTCWRCNTKSQDCQYQKHQLTSKYKCMTDVHRALVNCCLFLRVLFRNKRRIPVLFYISCLIKTNRLHKVCQPVLSMYSFQECSSKKNNSVHREKYDVWSDYLRS